MLRQTLTCPPETLEAKLQSWEQWSGQSEHSYRQKSILSQVKVVCFLGSEPSMCISVCLCSISCTFVTFRVRKLFLTFFKGPLTNFRNAVDSWVLGYVKEEFIRADMWEEAPLTSDIPTRARGWAGQWSKQREQNNQSETFCMSFVGMCVSVSVCTCWCKKEHQHVLEKGGYFSK